MLRKIKAAAGITIIALVTGAASAVAGVDYEIAFGPALGSLVTTVVAYSVKESLPILTSYIERWLGKPQG